MERPANDWFQTVSGRKFWPFDPRPADVAIEDIAHSLSHLCRFLGHTRSFYSVAQHSHHVSDLVPPRLALYGLLHDAAEAYVGDVISPIKAALRARTDAFDALERRVELAILARFDLHELSGPDQAEIKKADLIALATERRDLVTHAGHLWTLTEGVEPDDEVITPYTPIGARTIFLDRFRELMRRRA